MDACETFQAALPHGAGINSSWQYRDTGQSVRVSNVFECMNETGYYDGQVEFTVIIRKPVLYKWEGFKLQFNGARSQYYARKYQLRDYLDELIFDCLSAHFDKPRGGAEEYVQ